MGETASTEQNDPEVVRLAALTNDIMQGHTDLAVIRGLTDDELEAVYTLAYGFYASGKYEDALDMFRFLCLHRYIEPRFWFGFGAACQMCGHTPAALQAYAICGLLDTDDPQIPLRAAECFRLLGDEKNARSALDAALTIAGANPKHASVVERANMMRAALQQQAGTA